MRKWVSSMSTSIHLALKEIWRNRGRFLLFSLVIALITTLVLFVAALAEGLGSGNKEYLEKLNADLIVYQGDVDLSIAASRIALSKLNNIKRVAGVKEVGPIGFSSVSIAFEGDEEPLDISLIGVEPGKLGEPPVVVGRGLKRRRGKEAIIDKNVSLLTGLEVGHKFATKSIQGADKEFYTLEVIGISDSRKYGLRPSIFVPYLTWDRIKPQIVVGNNETELISNVVAVQLHHPEKLEYMS
ncbi:MAG: ABC transporter permease, partial [Anaerolineae bacterium]